MRQALEDVDRIRLAHHVRRDPPIQRERRNQARQRQDRTQRESRRHGCQTRPLGAGGQPAETNGDRGPAPHQDVKRRSRLPAAPTSHSNVRAPTQPAPQTPAHRPAPWPRSPPPPTRRPSESFRSAPPAERPRVPPPRAGEQRPTQSVPGNGQQHPRRDPSRPGQRRQRQPAAQPAHSDIKGPVRIGRVEKEIVIDPRRIPVVLGLGQVVRLVRLRNRPARVQCEHHVHQRDLDTVPPQACRVVSW